MEKTTFLIFSVYDMLASCTPPQLNLKQQDWEKLHQGIFEQKRLPLQHLFGVLDRSSYLMNLSVRMTDRCVSAFVKNVVDPAYEVIPVDTPCGVRFCLRHNTASTSATMIKLHAEEACALGDGTSDAKLLSLVEGDTYSTVRYVYNSAEDLFTSPANVEEVANPVIEAETVDALGRGISDLEIIDVGVEGNPPKEAEGRALSSTTATPSPSHSDSPENFTSSAGSHDVQVCSHANDQ